MAGLLAGRPGLSGTKTNSAQAEAAAELGNILLGPTDKVQQLLSSSRLGASVPSFLGWSVL